MPADGIGAAARKAGVRRHPAWQLVGNFRSEANYLVNPTPPQRAVAQISERPPLDWDVCFTPNSGHRAAGLQCPLSANSRHRAGLLDDASAEFAGLPSISQFYAADLLGRLQRTLSIDFDPWTLPGSILNLAPYTQSLSPRFIDAALPRLRRGGRGFAWFADRRPRGVSSYQRHV